MENCITVRCYAWFNARGLRLTLYTYSCPGLPLTSTKGAFHSQNWPAWPVTYLVAWVNLKALLYKKDSHLNILKMVPIILKKIFERLACKTFKFAHSLCELPDLTGGKRAKVNSWDQEGGYDPKLVPKVGCTCRSRGCPQLKHVNFRENLLGCSSWNICLVPSPLLKNGARI